MLVWCLGWTNAASLCQFNLKHWMIWKKKCGGFAKTHAHTGCGWWPKRVLWVKDEKEHFALDSNVFVLIPGLPTVLCHDSCPPIQSNRRSIPTPQWLCFKSLHLTMLVWEKALQNWKDLCSHRVQILRLSYTLCYVFEHTLWAEDGTLSANKQLLLELWTVSVLCPRAKGIISFQMTDVRVYNHVALLRVFQKPQYFINSFMAV